MTTDLLFSSLDTIVNAVLHTLRTKAWSFQYSWIVKTHEDQMSNTRHGFHKGMVTAQMICTV